MSDCDEQEVVNVEFIWMMECDRSLDDVIARLADVGVEVAPEQRAVVNRWLEMFSDDSPVPLGYRLSMLKGMLVT